MATTKLTVDLDEELVRRARLQDIGADRKSDSEVVEDAITIFLGDRALDQALAAGALSPTEADKLAVEEVHAVRIARRATA